MRSLFIISGSLLCVREVNIGSRVVLLSADFVVGSCLSLEVSLTGSIFGLFFVMWQFIFVPPAAHGMGSGGIMILHRPSVCWCVPTCLHTGMPVEATSCRQICSFFFMHLLKLHNVPLFGTMLEHPLQPKSVISKLRYGQLCAWLHSICCY